MTFSNHDIASFFNVIFTQDQRGDDNVIADATAVMSGAISLFIDSGFKTFAK